MTDKIDTSDIPEADEEFFKNAKLRMPKVHVTQELLPCPFCGGAAELRPDPGVCDVPYGLVVEHADDCILLGLPSADSEIIEAWNTRLASTPAPDAALAERIELELSQTKDWEPRLKTLLGDVLTALRQPDHAALLREARDALDSARKELSECGVCVGAQNPTAIAVAKAVARIDAALNDGGEHG